jgi:hypothetical protein
VEEEAWLRRFRIDYLQAKIAHLMVIGTTGTGKTTTLRWVADGFLECAKKNTLVWFDSGKSHELLVLAAGLSNPHPLNIILPETMDVDIQPVNGYEFDIRKSFIREPGEVWQKLVHSRINIVMIEPFNRRADKFAKIVKQIFSDLVDNAAEYSLPTPIRVFYHEFNKVVPGKGCALNPEHAAVGADVEYSVETLRSLGVGFVGSTQGWTDCRKGVRSHFDWQIGKSGAEFSHGRIAKFNSLFEKLSAEQAIIIYPDKTFSDQIRVPFYGDGEEFGTVRYIGKLTTKDDRRYQDGWMTINEFLGLPEDEPAPEEEDLEEDPDTGEPRALSPDLLNLLDPSTVAQLRGLFSETGGGT